MSSSPLIETEHFRRGSLEQEILVCRHRLHETGLFSDENIIRMIDAYPREFCNVNRMGTVEDGYEWSEGDTTGLDGMALLNAVHEGRLWLTLRGLTQRQPELRDIINQLYDELEQRCPGFRATRRTGNLLISSPTAIVYYHMDVPQNILWHIRGKKRVWVYPVENEQLLNPEIREAVCAVEREEDLPYSPEFDKLAEVHDLSPGDMITWPQNSPHRVENLEGLNISLSTEHYTREALRNVRVRRANRYFRQKTSLPIRCTKTSGVGYALKSTGFLSVLAFHRLFKIRREEFEIPVTFRVDPEASEGVAELAN